MMGVRVILALAVLNLLVLVADVLYNVLAGLAPLLR